jgi:PQQ-dependent catabolism-associated CXXCW motif protein
LALSAPAAFADAAEDCGKGGEAAIAGCSALIDKNPSDDAAYVNRGKAYFDKADYARASADFTEAIAIDPTDAKAYFNRGNVYLKLGKGKDAVADFQQALSLDPDYEDAKAAFEKATADLEGSSPPAASATPEPETGAEKSVDDKDSALSALRDNDQPDEASPPLPPTEPGNSPNKSSDMAVFVPDLPEEPGGEEPAPQTWPATPVAAKNYADETTDWGVKEQTVLKKDLGKKTPMVLPGARRITTQELQQIGPQSLLVDVLDDTDHHITLPGAVHVPGAGNYGGGRFNDKLQKKFDKLLMEVTGDNLDRQLVFFCYGAECWESYNAALRAISIGFHNVLWYRGGLESWKDAELPLAPPAVIHPVK